MVFNPQSAKTEVPSPGGSKVTIGRVIDIIMDDTHPDYDRFNGPDAIGMILYRPVDESIDTSESGEEVYSGEAFPFNPNFNTYPLKNEIVYIVKGPDKDLADGGLTDRDYYLTVVSIWNHPHINLYPVYDDTEPDAVNVGEGMDFLSNIAPLQPYPGDTIMQGKLGTSIRLSGGHSSKNPFATDGNKNTPFIFLSNGITNNNQGENGFEFINEDIDNDPSSFYLTSNQIIPITLSNSKRDSYDDAPEETNNFQDSQLVGNADRVIFNAKKDDILLSSVRSIGLNSTTLNLDGQEYMCLDADKIYLGKIARERDGAAKQPVMLGHEVESFLVDIIDIVKNMAVAMSKVTGDRGGPLGVLIKAGINANTALGIQQNKLNPKGSSSLKSKKTFVE